MRRLVGDDKWERLPPSTRAARRAEGPAMLGELSDLRQRPAWSGTEVRRPVLAVVGRARPPAPSTGGRCAPVDVAGRTDRRDRGRRAFRPEHPRRRSQRGARQLRRATTQRPTAEQVARQRRRRRASGQCRRAADPVRAVEHPAEDRAAPTGRACRPRCRWRASHPRAAGMASLVNDSDVTNPYSKPSRNTSRPATPMTTRRRRRP